MPDNDRAGCRLRNAAPGSALCAADCPGLLSTDSDVVANMAQVEDKEIFKVCLEFFEVLGKSLYEEWYDASLER